MKKYKNRIKRAAAVATAMAAVLSVGSLGGAYADAAYDAELTVREPVYGNYFTSEFETKDEALAFGEEVNKEIFGEGVTMLKNENNALPLGQGAQVSVFGKNSVNMLTSGSGSGAGGGGSVVTLTQALKDEGFAVNPALTNFYGNNDLSGAGRINAPGNGNVVPGYITGETPLASYTQDVKDSYANYNDAAIVVISRIAGEGFDLPRTMKYNGSSFGSWGADATQIIPGARSMDDHYLQLDKNESDLIKYCGENFDKVVVLFNTGSQFETGFLDDPGHYGYHENVKAGLWIGYPGGNGLTSLAKILKGEINPSGKTVDTWARDFKKDPVWQNFGNNMIEIDGDHKGNKYPNIASSGGNGGGGYRGNYVVYKEGIYIGYRYYETRAFVEGADAYTPTAADAICGTETTSWDNWYDAHVVYPFGHGLSYTTFTQEIVESVPASGAALTADGKITVKVKVTNTGDVAGKDVAQIYFTAPYTPNGIEKSHVVLGGYEKTKLLASGESETLEITLSVRDMASYDWDDANKNGFTGYEVEGGEYEIKLMRDAHNEIDKVTYTVAETAGATVGKTGFTYGTSETTGYAIENRFDKVSNYLYEITNNGEKYMSRANFTGTFPVPEMRTTAPDWVVAGVSEWDNRPASKDKDQPYYTEVMPTQGKKLETPIKLGELMGVDYEDPKWNDFMDQLTVDQLQSLASNGGYASGLNDSNLGITRTTNADGPAGWSVGAPGGKHVFWCAETVLSSTYSKELAEKKGKAMGEEALWYKIGGWYAPAVNIHRSPFSGRNFEYYSEDGFHAGMMSAYVIRGAQEKGLFCYVKHFGVNDQESNRCGLLTWLNEQSMREIYIRPFELDVKVGKTRAMMSSLNRIGYEPAGCNYQLLTEILRNEWGFKGNVVTDSWADAWHDSIDHMIRGGGNLCLGGGGNVRYNVGTATTVTALRNAAKGILYAHVNSLAMNTGATPVTPKPIESFVSTPLTAAVMGGVYNANIATAVISKVLYPDGNDADIVYTLNANSVLPSGLELTPDGKLTGSPTEEVNNFRFTVDATYADYTLSCDFTITVINANGSIIYETDTELGAATIGEACNIDIASAIIVKPDAEPDEIFPTITYALASGSLLPDGLQLTTAGKIVGTPTREASDYGFTVLASALGYKDVAVSFTLSVFNKVEFAGRELVAAKFGVSYVQSVAFAVTQSEHPVRYELSSESTLPTGLIMTAGGLITGTPTEVVKDHAFTVYAISDYAQTQSAEFTLSVGLAFNPIELANGKQGVQYTASVDTAQGAGEVTYSLKEDSVMPKGLTLNADGSITGTPEIAGVYVFTVVASAEGQLGDEMTVKLYVANGEPKPVYVPDTVKSNVGGIVGGVVGGVAGAAAIAVGVLFLLNYLKKKKATAGAATTETVETHDDASEKTPDYGNAAGDEENNDNG